MMKSLFAAVLLSILPARAGAAAILCDQQTTGMRLCLPRYGTDFSNWARADIAAFQALNSSGAANSTTSVHMADWLMVHRISGLATGTVGVQISSYTWFTSSAAVVGGGGLSVTYGVSAATAVVTYVQVSSLTATTSLKVAGGSVTANAYTTENSGTGGYGFGGVTTETQGMYNSGGNLILRAGSLGMYLQRSDATNAMYFTGTDRMQFPRGVETPYGVVAGTGTYSGRVTAPDYTATYGVSAATATITYVQVSSITATDGVTANYGVKASTFQSGDGGVSAPSYRGTDADTGMYFDGSGSVLFGVNGTLRGSVMTGVGVCGGDGGTGKPCLRSSAGSASDPGLQWGGDTDTGMRRVSSNDQALVAGGVDVIEHNATQIRIFPQTTKTSTFTSTGELSIPSSMTASAFFGDGSNLTGITGGSGASLTSTNTWSGAQLFLSSPAAGPQVYTSTAITGPGAVLSAHRSLWINSWTVVASTKFYSGGTTSGFTGFRQGVTYRVEFDIITTSAGTLLVKWNGASSGYKYASNGQRSDGSALTSNSESGSACIITFGSLIPDNGETHGFLHFRISDDDATRVWAWGSLVTQNSTPSLFSANTSCYLDDSANINSIQFIAGSNIKGTMQLFERTLAQP